LGRYSHEKEVPVIFRQFSLTAAAAIVLLAGCAQRGDVPVQWGENATGVKTRIDTSEKVIALTLDACGSANDGYDAALIGYLDANKVPATLFINARWIDKNPGAFLKLASNPLFEIEDHGLDHKPASVNGRSAYGIAGTKDRRELEKEIGAAAKKIEKLTGRKPKFYRSGTAYYDEIAVRIANGMGYQVAGFSVLGDRGATYSWEEVRSALLTAKPGDIIICHMNHPERETAEGVIAAIPELRKMGFKFVRLDEFPLK